MAKAKDEEFEKEYNELRLRYALEDPEIEKLFNDWIRQERENITFTYVILHEHLGAEAFKVVHPEFEKANELWNNIVKKLHGLGILLFTSYDIYATYCHATKKDYWPHAVSPRKLSSILIRVDSKLLSAAHLKKDIHIIKDIFEKGNFEEHEEWFKQNYDKLALIKDFRDGAIDSFDIARMLKGDYKDDPWTFNRKTKKFYQFYEDEIEDEYGEPIEGPTFFEDSTLEDGKYLNLKIDLSRRSEHIKAELKYVVKCFKDIFDGANEIKTKTKTRRQNIELYKQYLRVYRLVQEKGKKKWAEIAEEVFPGEQDDPDKKASALAKVHNYYKEAKILIAEGLP